MIINDDLRWQDLKKAREIINSMLEEGRTQKCVAEEIGVYPQKISLILKKFNMSCYTTVHKVLEWDEKRNSSAA